MRVSTELYQQIRRLHIVDGISQRKLAEMFHVSRQTIKRYCKGNYLPVARQEYSKEKSPLREELEKRILKIIEDNKTAPKKQKLNAKEVWRVLIQEGYSQGESTIRKYIQEMRLENPEAFVPLEFEPGEAMEFDWGDMVAIIGGLKTKVSAFCVVLPYSYGIHVSVFPDKTNTSFFSGHVNAFECFGGVPLRCIYDNLKNAVLENSGKDAVTQEKFKLLEAHYAFEAVFCNASSGWEKGGVENLVSIARSIAFTPVPSVRNFEELQELVTRRCVEYCNNHKIRGRQHPIKEMLEYEKTNLLPLPLTPFDPCEEFRAKVNKDLTVRFQSAKYSVPAKYIDLYVTIKVTPFHIDIYYQGEKLWMHKRALHSSDHQYIPEHYLEILERKPRAIQNAAPLKSGVMPQELKDFLKLCKLRDKNYQLIQILLLCKTIESEKVLWAVKEANSTGVPSYDLVCFYMDLSSSTRCDITQDIKVQKADFSQYDKMIGAEPNE